MGASVRPERRPSLDEIVQRADRPSLDSIVGGAGGQMPSPGRMSALANPDAAAARAFRAEQTPGDKVAAALANFFDAGTYGLAGVASDAVQAIGPESFRTQRDARKMLREDLSGTDRLLSSVGGSLLNPVSRLVPTRLAGPITRADGFVKTTAKGLLEGAAQGTAQAVGENIGTTGGTKDAALEGALFGGVLGGAVPGAIRLGQRGHTVARGASAVPVDVRRFQMKDAMEEADKLFYGAVKHEAGQVGTSPAIQTALTDPTIAKYAKIVRGSKEWAGASDAEVLVEAHKRMSEIQMSGVSKNQKNPVKSAKIAQQVRDLGAAKKELKDAAVQSGIPLDVAVDVHRTAMGRAKAFEKTSDHVSDILHGRSTSGGFLLTKSEEAFRRKIAKMTPGEAQDALDALLGRGREVVRLTDNPVGQFGAIATAARLLRAPGKLDEYIRLLEARGGKKPSIFGEALEQNESRIPGLLGRIAGSGK